MEQVGLITVKIRFMAELKRTIFRSLALSDMPDTTVCLKAHLQVQNFSYSSKMKVMFKCLSQSDRINAAIDQ